MWYLFLFSGVKCVCVGVFCVSCECVVHALCVFVEVVGSLFFGVWCGFCVVFGVCLYFCAYWNVFLVRWLFLCACVLRICVCGCV